MNALKGRSVKARFWLLVEFRLRLVLLRVCGGFAEFGGALGLDVGLGELPKLAGCQAA